MCSDPFLETLPPTQPHTHLATVSTPRGTRRRHIGNPNIRTNCPGTIAEGPFGRFSSTVRKFCFSQSPAPLSRSVSVIFAVHCVGRSRRIFTTPLSLLLGSDLLTRSRRGDDDYYDDVTSRFPVSFFSNSRCINNGRE